MLTPFVSFSPAFPPRREGQSAFPVSQLRFQDLVAQPEQRSQRARPISWRSFSIVGCSPRARTLAIAVLTPSSERCQVVSQPRAIESFYYGCLARIASARDSSCTASSRRPMLRNSNAQFFRHVAPFGCSGPSAFSQMHRDCFACQAD